VVGGGAVPDAVNVTGLPVGTAAAAVTELLSVPTADPRVQLESVAMPFAPVAMVAGLAGLVLPPPLATVNVTFTPLLGFPKASVTTTEGGAATAVLIVADWEVAEFAAMELAGPAVAVAVNVTGLPLGTAAAAVTLLLFVPAVVPRVQLVSVATPFTPVATVAGLAGTMVPPPAVTVKVTFNPLTGFPLTSVTRTDGAAATAAPTVPDCETAELAAMVWAEPALTVIVPEVTLTNPPDAKIKVRGPTVPVILRLLNVATPDALVVAFRVPPRCRPHSGSRR
jgi:hypothetical protein